MNRKGWGHYADINAYIEHIGNTIDAREAHIPSHGISARVT